MKKITNEKSEMHGMPRAMSVNVRFDKELQKITGNEGHSVIISEGASFLYLLMNVFMECPEIEEKYPPGLIGFSINGIPPRDHSILFDGDTVDFSALSV
ncbi:MAG: hypothetical protein WAV98_01345 [Minisyncoccia bacterium]